MAELRAATGHDRAVRASGARLIARYIVVGAVNTAASYAFYCLFLFVGAPYPLASLGALVLGIIVSFFTVGTYVFASRLRGRFPAFVAVWGALYFINIGIIALILLSGLSEYAAGLAAIAPTSLIAFFMQRHLVFR